MRTLFKIVLFSYLFIFTVSGVDAQIRRKKLTSDFFVGLNLASMDIEGANMDKVSKLGIQVGGNVNYKILGNIQVQTGFYVTKRGLAQNVKRTTVDEVTNKIVRSEMKYRTAAAYLQIPVCLGYEVYLSNNFAFNINGGVYGAYGFRGKRWEEGFETRMDSDGLNKETEIFEKEENNTFEIQQWKRLDYGLIGKVGLIYDIYTINVGYEYGLYNVSDNEDNILKNRTLTISLGFRF